MNRMAITLLTACLCASCHSPAPKPSTDAVGQVAIPGGYCFSTIDLQMELDLRADGTYYASMDSWAKRTEERGLWRTEGKDIVLTSQSGGLQMAVRRLGPVLEANPSAFHIVEPDSELGRAIIFRRTALCQINVFSKPVPESNMPHLFMICTPTEQPRASALGPPSPFGYGSRAQTAARSTSSSMRARVSLITGNLRSCSTASPWSPPHIPIASAPVHQTGIVGNQGGVSPRSNPCSYSRSFSSRALAARPKASGTPAIRRLGNCITIRHFASPTEAEVASAMK